MHVLGLSDTRSCSQIDDNPHPPPLPLPGPQVVSVQVKIKTNFFLRVRGLLIWMFFIKYVNNFQKDAFFV